MTNLETQFNAVKKACFIIKRQGLPGVSHLKDAADSLVTLGTLTYALSKIAVAMNRYDLMGELRESLKTAVRATVQGLPPDAQTELILETQVVLHVLNELSDDKSN